MSAVFDAAASWGSTYANHAALRTLVVFAHVGSLIVGGGAAIAADRAALNGYRLAPGDRGATLDVLQNTHRIVTISLVLVVVSGLAMFAADVDTFLHSKIFWTKMAIVALLLTNGGLLYLAEKRAARGDGAAWTTLRATAIVSVTLWMAATLAGVALTTAG